MQWQLCCSNVYAVDIALLPPYYLRVIMEEVIVLPCYILGMPITLDL